MIEEIKDRSPRIGVIGLGYVGLPLANEFASAGFDVLGVDVNLEKVEQLTLGKSPVPDVPDEELKRNVDAGRLKFSIHFNELSTCGAVIICVPTPLNKTRDPDVSFVVDSLENLKSYIAPGQLVILESTTYPGFTAEVMRPILESTGLKCDQDFFLAFSPERIDPGNKEYGLPNTPKVVGGCSQRSLELASALYGQIVNKVVPVSSTDTAEVVKLFENTFRAVNIGLVNELAQICHKLDVDVNEVIDAAASKPFGFMEFRPGPGLGGHCIPIDPLYLSWKLKSLKFDARFIELADSVNTFMPHFVVDLVADALNDHELSVKGRRILVLGVAYKRDINDVRESPALRIIDELMARGAKMTYHDAYIPAIETSSGPMESVDLDQGLDACDLALIITNHGYIDYKDVVRRAPIVVDTRNATKGIQADPKRLYRL